MPSVMNEKWAGPPREGRRLRRRKVLLWRTFEAYHHADPQIVVHLEFVEGVSIATLRLRSDALKFQIRICCGSVPSAELLDDRRDGGL
jgi:hypothetical protein